MSRRQIPKNTENYRDGDRWKEEQEQQFGRLHRISSKALVEVGAPAACILSHLYFLQNYTPKGGHVPMTPEGERAAFNTVQQIHERLPFIPLDTIKYQLKTLAATQHGFRVMRVKNHRANHYHISEALAVDLDLVFEDKSFYFHADEAIQYGIFQAILLQRIAYCNTGLLGKKTKDPMYIDVFAGYKSFAKDIRKVERAAVKLAQYVGMNGEPLLFIDGEKGFVVDPVLRMFIMNYYRGERAAKITPSETHSATPGLPKLSPRLQNLLLPKPRIEAQLDQGEGVPSTPIVLNRTNRDQGNIENEEASPTPLFLLPPNKLSSSKVSKHGALNQSGTSVELAPEIVKAQNRFMGNFSESPCDVDHVMGRPRFEPDEVESLRCHSESSSMVQATSTTFRSSISERPIACQSPIDSSSSAPSRTPDSFTSSEVCLRSYLQFSIPLDQFYTVPLKAFDLSRRDRAASQNTLREIIRRLDLIETSETEHRIRQEVEENPELRPEELLLIFMRVQESNAQNFIAKYEGKFNPYFHSCGISYANQLIAHCYLILEDIYRVSAKEKCETGCSKDKLREDTPEHIRAYIMRKRRKAGRALFLDAT